MDHASWSMVQDLNNRKESYDKAKHIKTEYMPGGAKRQEMLDKAVDYLRTPGATQQIKHEFCLTYLMMTETEYLEALNKATNGQMVRDLWN
jgi:hypothetical protein